MNDALSWALRLAYPATAVMLWRRWVPGGWFLAYLLAAGLAMAVYRVDDLALAVALTLLLYPLQLAVTVELCRALIFDTWPAVKKHISRAMWAVVIVGTGISWGFRQPHGAWGWLGFARTSIDGACLIMTAMVLAFVGRERLRAHWLQWVHAIIWAGYVAPQIAAGMLRQHLPENSYGADLWDEITGGVWMIRIGCLALWGWFGIRNRRSAI